MLFDQTRKLGDVVVITTRRYVAKWARTVARFESKAGTKIALAPIVLHIGPDEVNKLLDPARPGLAFFAAWAMQDRHGPEAVAAVKRSLEVTDQLPEPLRKARRRAIFSVLSEKMLALLEEASVDPSKIVLNERQQRAFDAYNAREAAREAALEAAGAAKGLVVGKRGALLSVLKARGLSVADEERATIEACADPATLDAWIAAAVSAPTVAEVLASALPPRAA